MHRIILDTDIAMGAPGSDIDDGFALALCVDMPDQSLELVTTVNGNTDVDTSTLLALDLLNRLGNPDVPVVKGARTPLLRPLHDHPARDRVAGVQERLIGLDVTLQVQLRRADADRLEATGRPFAAYAGQCTNAWIDYLQKAYPGQGFTSAPMHDPLAVAMVSRPDLVTWRPARVEVETTSPITRGITIADMLTSENPPEANCHVATEVDSDAFIDFFLEHIFSL